MTVSAKQQDMTALRRRRVAALRLKGLTHEEIYQALAMPGQAQIVNPKTNEPYDRTQITRDLKKIRAEALETAHEAMEQHLADELAQIHELRRAAWAEKAYGIVARCIEMEMKLLGTAAPDKHLIVNIELMQQVTDALTAAGEDATTVFERLRDAALARQR